MAKKFNRAEESLGNILHMEHVNLAVSEQKLATVFYIAGLQFTRDPFIMNGIDNMWVNMGRCQVHLPSRNLPPQRLRGAIGMVVPNLDEVANSLERVSQDLVATDFRFTRESEHIEATCPWGNKFKIHGPAPEYGAMHIGMPYVELNVPVGTTERIGRFYQEILGASISLGTRHNADCLSVSTGKAQYLHFIETDLPQPDYDGHHIAIYISDFAQPYEKLLKRDLISMETDEHEWRFIDIIDLDSKDVLFKIEHEVRSATHPLYARPLINRNPGQSNRGYRPGQDNFLGQI